MPNDGNDDGLPRGSLKELAAEYKDEIREGAEADRRVDDAAKDINRFSLSHPALNSYRNESWEIARILRACVRDFHLGNLVESGACTGIYVLTPDHELEAWAKREIEALVLKCGKPFMTKTRFFS
jgi:hypothetical protein